MELNKRFYFLVLASGFMGFSIGYIKFFIVSYLTMDFYPVSDKDWIIQIVSAAISLGMGLIVAVSVLLSSSMQKRWVMTNASFALFFVVLLGYILEWSGEGVWFYLPVLGFAFGLFGGAKNALIPIEAKATNRMTENINAWLTLSFIFMMILAIPLSTYLYEQFKTIAIYPAFLSLLLSAILSSKLFYKEEFDDIKELTLSQLGKETKALIINFRYHLLATSLIWGIASAFSLSITALVELQNIGTAVEASMIPVIATIGLITGSFLTSYFVEKRYSNMIKSGIIISVLIATIPVFVFEAHNIGMDKYAYYVVALLSFVSGVGFGVFANLVDSDYLARSLELKLEGFAGPLLTTATSLSAFAIGGAIGYLIIFGFIDIWTQFILLWLLIILASIIGLKMLQNFKCTKNKSK